MAHETKTMKASELVEDFAVYPRNCVFDGHVADLAESIRAGAVLPAVVACRATKRIVDGFHRRRANVKANGEDAELEVTLIDYEDDAALVLDAMTRNAQHGRRLTTADFARCALLAENFNISRERIAESLCLTRERLDKITVSRFATGREGKVVLRRAQAHLAGTVLTEAQELAAPYVGGQTALAHVNNLIHLIESDSMPEDRRLHERLQRLHSLLDRVLGHLLAG